MDLQTYAMPSRSFTGPDGVAWQAWDVIPGEHYSDNARRHLPEDMADGWLCFESESEKRRLREIPENWAESTEDDLRRLCNSAEPVQRRVRQAG